MRIIFIEAVTTFIAPTPTPAPAGAVPLHALARGASATVVHLRKTDDASDRELLLRLIEIGFLPGETVRVVARAAGGREPIAVRLGGQATFALRRREADLLQVHPEPGRAAP
jgi:ferrous iron transport protein A